MMKLTVTFLAALAAADATESRHARRQNYGYGNEYSAKPYQPETPTVYSAPATVATPAAASSVQSFPAIPYNSQSSKPPTENQSTMGYPSASNVPVAASSKPGNEYPTGYGTPVEASSVPKSSPAGYPTGGYASSKPVEASSVPKSSPAGYPTGGYGKPSSKPVEASSKPYPTDAQNTSCTDVLAATKTPIGYNTQTLTQVLTYTMGTGITARVSTTTVYSTIVVTVTKPGAKPTGGSGYPTGGQDEGTTTIKSTTTTTVVVTVHKPAQSSQPAGYDSQPAGVVSGAAYPTGPGGNQCPAPVTVTVTDKQTVTVTKGSQATGGQQSGYPAQPSKPVAGESSRKPYSHKPSATASFKYPTGGNGTYPAGPTGFKTSGQPYGTGVPTKPTSVPSFSYVSKPYSAESPAPAKSNSVAGYAVSSPAPVKATSVQGYAPVPMSSAPAPAKSSPAGYNYGS